MMINKMKVATGDGNQSSLLYGRKVKNVIKTFLKTNLKKMKLVLRILVLEPSLGKAVLDRFISLRS
jgi:hypothetical protein